MPCQFCHCLGGIHGCAGFTKAFDDKTSTTDGWGFGPPASYPHAEGMLLDDTLVLHTRLKIAEASPVLHFNLEGRICCVTSCRLS